MSIWGILAHIALWGLMFCAVYEHNKIKKRIKQIVSFCGENSDLFTIKRAAAKEMLKLQLRIEVLEEKAQLWGSISIELEQDLRRHVSQMHPGEIET